MSDVFITGIGAVTCLGTDVPASWNALAAGRRGIRPIEGVDLAGCRTTFAGQVRRFSPPPRTQHADRAVQLAVHAADQALADARVAAESLARFSTRAAAVIGSSKGAVLRFATMHADWLDRRGRNATCLAPPNDHDGGAFWDTVPPHAVGDAIVARFAIAGPRLCPVAACATGTIAVIRAAQMIADGRADLVLCGAADASIHPLWLAAFEQMGAMATPHPRDGPAGACRPFDVARSGFAVSEGAGMLVLESRASVARRAARPIARLRGWALGSDPHGLTTVDPTATPLAEVVETACARAGIDAADLDLIDAHGTGTIANDAAEATVYRAISLRRGGPITVTALKGALGHSLGAAGALETVLTVESLRRQTILPTMNHRSPAPDTQGVAVVRDLRPASLDRVLKASLGFGGHVAALILAQP